MARITVEDCLRESRNRFELVLLGARRAKQLLKGARPLVDSGNKEIVTALREIASGKVRLGYEDETQEQPEETAEEPEQPEQPEQMPT